jgi:cell shape-determining protein MreC
MPEIVEMIKQQQSQLQQYAASVAQLQQLNKALLEKLRAHETKEQLSSQPLVTTIVANTSDPSSNEVSPQPSADPDKE